MNSHSDSRPEKVPHYKSRTKPKCESDIKQRAFDFAVRIVKLCKYLERETAASRSITTQLLRSGTSIGANLEEAAAGESRADFIHKNAISLKEARETQYWLRIVASTETLTSVARAGLDEVIKESDELARILGKIVSSSKRNKAGKQ